MSLRHAIYYSCDSCTGYSDHRDTEDLARNAALSAGWRLGLTDDFCGECVKLRARGHRGPGIDASAQTKVATRQAEGDLLRVQAAEHPYTEAVYLDVIAEHEADSIDSLMSEAPTSARTEIDAPAALRRLGLMP